MNKCNIYAAQNRFSRVGYSTIRLQFPPAVVFIMVNDVPRLVFDSSPKAVAITLISADKNSLQHKNAPPQRTACVNMFNLQESVKGFIYIKVILQVVKYKAKIAFFISYKIYVRIFDGCLSIQYAYPRNLSQLLNLTTDLYCAHSIWYIIDQYDVLPLLSYSLYPSPMLLS